MRLEKVAERETGSTVLGSPVPNLRSLRGYLQVARQVKHDDSCPPGTVTTIAG
jgi:hypothetical protein